MSQSRVPELSYSAQLMELLRTPVFELYLSVFTPDGLDPITLEFKGYLADRINAAKRDDYLNTLILTATFFGLDHRDMFESAKPSLFKINLGWQENKSDERNLINYIKTFYSAPKNIFFSILITLYHCIKLVTQFLPGFLSIFFNALAILANRGSMDYKHLPSVAYTLDILNYFAQTFGLLFNTIYCLGRTIIDPIQSVKAAWEYGHDLLGNNWAGHVLGTGLCILGIACTATAFVFLSQLFIPIDPGSLFMFAESFFTSINLSTACGFAMMGLSLGIGLSTLGTLLNEYLINPCRDFWSRTGNTKAIPASNYISLPLHKTEEMYKLNHFFHDAVATEQTRISTPRSMMERDTSQERDSVTSEDDAGEEEVHYTNEFHISPSHLLHPMNNEEEFQYRMK